MLYTGCVENRNDPMKLGRCQVRVVGVHTHDKTSLPTEDLPWAYPLQPITSAAISGIGYSPLGVVEGSWVVIMFRDPDDLQQPIILGTIGGIPQAENKGVEEEDDDSISIDGVPEKTEDTPKGNFVTDGSGNTVTDGNGNPVQTGTSAVTNTTATTPATTTKPSGKIPPASAKKGIDALNQAMDAVSFKGKYGRASVLAIAMGESGCVPQSEGFFYKTAEVLMTVFGSTFKNKPELAQKYAKWTGTRESFFDLVYAPENNGRQLGNTQPGDGGKFYGRGFIQLTGRANYARYARLSSVDILSQPDLLNNDYDASARVAVSYFKDRVTKSPDDPGYLEEALKKIGNDTGTGGYDKKRGYYQYFLGESGPPPEQTDKSTKPGNESQGIPVAENGLPVDRQKNITIGFNDPNMKYPLRSHIGEPDTNRLARGRINGTIVEYKDSKRLQGIKTGAEFTWDQPDIPYNAKYPFNKVMETESGHVMEFDDTPDNERVHIYHRKGTYTEIDANGSQVNRIVGDGYYIMERNGYVFVGGDCNLTVEGNVRLLINADALIDVTGDAKINVAGSSSLNVASDMSVNVGGKFALKASGINLESTGDFNVNASGSNKLTSGGGFHANASGEARLEGSTVHLAEGADSAESSGLGGAISAGTKNTKTFEQLKPEPRNLEQEVLFETPEENTSDTAKEYHENRDTTSTGVEKPPVKETEATAKPENTAKGTDPSCDVIYGMASLPTSYVLYTDKTGHNWTIAQLVRQNTLTPGKYGAPAKDYTIQDLACNLKALCVNILGPLNENIGPVGKAWNITSCYRSAVVSGGSTTSQHMIGSAVDISIGGNYGYKINYDWAVKLAAILPYDQMLLEYRDPGVNGSKDPKRINWLHISYNNYGPGRKDLRTFLNDKTYKTELVNLGT